ncbi:MAG: efflux RND transporter periplasmic adaptor subunit [Aquificae bacterium]|nr:efflux RND transporter periplasmic adaptor subunit [Aquificota bacterium]
MDKVKKAVKILLLILIVALLVVGGVRLIKIRKQEVANTPPPQEPVYTVEYATVKKGSVSVEDRFTGFIKPYNTVQVMAKIPAYIKKIYVKTNQPVKKGELIILLDDTQIKSQINTVKIDIQNLKLQLQTLKAKEQALKTQLETNRNIYLRNKKLYEKKAIPQEALEKSLTAYKLSQAQYKEVLQGIKQTENRINQLKEKVKSLENELTYLQIHSPVDGVVQRINIREGNIPPMGKSILNIETSGRYEIIVKLPPDYPVAEGDPMVVETPVGRKELQVKMVCPSASPEGLKVIKSMVKEKPKGVVSNSYIKVYLPKTASGFVVPATAILHLTDGTYLLTLKEGRFIKIPVKVVLSNGKEAVVEGNIQEGLKVAVGEESKLRLLSFGRKGKFISRGDSYEQ